MRLRTLVFITVLAAAFCTGAGAAMAQAKGGGEAAPNTRGGGLGQSDSLGKLLKDGSLGASPYAETLAGGSLGKGGWRGKTQYGINQELAFPVGLGIYQGGKRVGVETVQIPAE